MRTHVHLCSPVHVRERGEKTNGEKGGSSRRVSRHVGVYYWSELTGAMKR